MTVWLWTAYGITAERRSSWGEHKREIEESGTKENQKDKKKIERAKRHASRVSPRASGRTAKGPVKNEMRAIKGEQKQTPVLGENAIDASPFTSTAARTWLSIETNQRSPEWRIKRRPSKHHETLVQDGDDVYGRRE